MDMQTAILHNLSEREKVKMLLKANETIKLARSHGNLVIFVRVGFRKNLPEIGKSNQMFSQFKRSIKEYGEEKYLQLEPSLERKEDDVVITKRRVSAFPEVILR